MKNSFAIFGIMFVSGATTAARANYVNIPAAKDNTLYLNVTGATSNGAGQHFFAGNTGSSLVRRGVISFDVAGYIPPGSTIESVTLKLNFSRTLDLTPRTVSLHQLLADWGEGTSDAVDEEGQGADSTTGDATWVHRFFNTQLWSAAGGDFNATASASQTIPVFGEYGPVTWSSAGMTSDVQNWLDNPASNFGWILVGDESEPATSRRFDSVNNPNIAVRPNLRIVFAPPPGTPAVNGIAMALAIILIIGIAFVALRRRLQADSNAR